MKSEERENLIYSEGKINKIDIEEKLMFSLLPEGNNRKLLDIGCGTGEISKELMNRGFTVTGVDFSEVAIEKAKTKGINAIVSDLDKDGIKLDDNSLDVVWASDVIEHLFDPMFVLKEAKRVLKKGGSLIFSVPNDFNIYNRLLIGLKGKSIQTGAYRRFKISKHHTFFSWGLVKFMLEEAGLEIEAVLSILYIPNTKYKKESENLFFIRYFGKYYIIKAIKRGD